jgi:hypothetical protein
VPSRPVAVHVGALGTTFRVGSDDQGVLSQLERLWRPLLCTAADVADEHAFSVEAAGRGWVLRQGSTPRAAATELGPLFGALASLLNAAAIERSLDLAVHSGAVARGGSVLAFPADSGVGKSTLTAACVALGWRYVSDEALCLGDGGEVIPYPKPLTLSTWARARVGLTQLPAAVSSRDEEHVVGLDDLGGQVSEGRLRLAEVVFLKRREDRRGAPRLIPRHRAEVLTGLLALSFNHYKNPERSVHMLAELATECRAWRLEYSDAGEAAALLDESFPDPCLADVAAGAQRRRLPVTGSA